MSKGAILIGLTMFAMTPASATTVTPGCKDAAVEQTKSPARKPSDPRKRTSSTSLGKGCIGCIVPLDGISSTMAVRTLS